MSRINGAVGMGRQMSVTAGHVHNAAPFILRFQQNQYCQATPGYKLGTR